jgi:hypothetical protein
MFKQEVNLEEGGDQGLCNRNDDRNEDTEEIDDEPNESE